MRCTGLWAAELVGVARPWGHPPSHPPCHPPEDGLVHAAADCKGGRGAQRLAQRAGAPVGRARRRQHQAAVHNRVKHQLPQRVACGQRQRREQRRQCGRGWGRHEGWAAAAAATAAWFACPAHPTPSTGCPPARPPPLACCQVPAPGSEGGDGGGAPGLVKVGRHPQPCQPDDERSRAVHDEGQQGVEGQACGRRWVVCGSP
jgi:hypothetical protein